MARLVVILLITVLGSLPFSESLAGPATKAQAAATSAGHGKFVKNRYKLDGSWEIRNIGGQTEIRFSDDFKTKNGPDVKLFLSPRPISEVTAETLRENSFNIGVLKSNSGAQTYTVPNDLNLADYRSVVIHCEAYAVTWGGFDIPR